jgi:integrase/recombinase XerD
MLSAPWDREKNEHKRTRDSAIIQILYWSGLRVSELCNLRLSDIHADSNQFSVVGKGRKMRSVFMTKSALEALSKWIEMRWWVGEYILTGISNNQKNNENEKPLSRNAIEDIIRHYAKLQGIDKKVTPHTLRHSFATSLIKKWADIRSVQTLLWHSSITTTQIYTHVDDKYLKGIHDLLN